MSDTGRKDLSSQIGDKLKPDAQKTSTEKIGDQASGTYDRLASAITPESQKSTKQQMGDGMRGNKDEASERSKGVGQSLADDVKGAVDSVTGNNK